MTDYILGFATGVFGVFAGLIMWYKYMDYLDELERGTASIRVDHHVPRVHVQGNDDDCLT